MSVLSIAGSPAQSGETGSTDADAGAGEPKIVAASEGFTKWAEGLLSGVIPWVDRVVLDWEALSPLVSTLSGVVVIVATLWGRFGWESLTNISSSVPKIGA